MKVIGFQSFSQKSIPENNFWPAAGAAKRYFYSYDVGAPSKKQAPMDEICERLLV